MTTPTEVRIKLTTFQHDDLASALRLTTTSTEVVRLGATYAAWPPAYTPALLAVLAEARRREQLAGRPTRVLAIVPRKVAEATAKAGA